MIKFTLAQIKQNRIVRSNIESVLKKLDLLADETSFVGESKIFGGTKNPPVDHYYHIECLKSSISHIDILRSLDYYLNCA